MPFCLISPAYRRRSLASAGGVRDPHDPSLLIDPEGRIWRTMRYGKRCEPYRAESPRGAGDGSLMVHRGKGGGVSAHWLVYQVLIGPVPQGSRVGHRNGNRADNHPENLVLGSASKLSFAAARAIRRRRAAGESQAALGRAFGVSQPTIWAIVTGRTWKDARPVATGVRVDNRTGQLSTLGRRGPRRRHGRVK